MIIQEGGRWRNVQHESETQAAIDELISKMKPNEVAALQELLGEIDLSGKSRIADACATMEWEEVPLPIEEWLESYHHVGDLKDSIYPVLKKDLIDLFSGNYHEVILCLHPDTRVPLLDGTAPTIKELSERWLLTKEPYWVYSYKDGELSPAQAVEPRQTGVDDYYRVTLDDGSSFTGNSRHQMLLRNGTKRMIKDMSVGDSLMPFDVRLSSKERDDLNGYEQIRLLTGEWVYSHRLVARASCERPSTRHSVVHHEDFNKRNNAPANLRWMTWKDHTDLHLLHAHRERRKDITIESIRAAAKKSLKETAVALGCSCSRLRFVLNTNGVSARSLFGDRRGRRRSGTETTLATIKQTIANGAKSIHDVAEMLGRDRTSIYWCLKKSGVPWSEIKPLCGRQTWKITLDQLRDAISDGSQTPAAAAERLGCNVSTVHRLLSRCGMMWADVCSPVVATNHYVVKVEHAGRGPVYCMTVPDAGNFAISTSFDGKEVISPTRRSGVVSSNTGSTRWG